MSRHVRLGECSGITPQVLWDDGRVWHKSAERVVYSGYRTILSRTFATPDGVHDFEIELEPDAAVSLALTPAREVLLVREFRPGTEEWLLELPAATSTTERKPMPRHPVSCSKRPALP